MNKVSFREAGRRYTRGMIPVMVVYTAFCLTVPPYLGKMEEPATWMMATSAIIQSIPMLAVFWLVARFLRETDEYHRRYGAEALLVAGAITLSITLVWGLLEQYQVIPRLDYLSSMIFVLPAYWLVFGVVIWLQSRQRGDSLSCETD